MFRSISTRTLIVLFGGALFATATAQAQTTWYVDDDAPNDPGPGDPTISDPLEDGSPGHPFDGVQEGIDVAAYGDTVLVLDGTYTGTGNKDLDLGGKGITVRSENGPDNCIIDCQGSEDDPHRGFYFHSGETGEAVVDGFTIRDGYVTGDSPGGARGGGIYCNGASPTIMNCTITGNKAARGGGVSCVNSSALIANCTITRNSVWSVGWEPGGGGISCGGQGNPRVVNCRISGNTVLLGSGGGIYCYAVGCNATITNCTITGNVAGVQGGGIRCLSEQCNVTVTNCVFWGNSARRGAEIAVYGAELAVSYCDVEGGEIAVHVGPYTELIWGDGNIDADPGFAFLDDCHLVSGSPCVDAGTNDPPGGLPASDLDGNARPLDGDGDSVAIADMGVYEFNPDDPSIAVSPDEIKFFAPQGGPDPEDQVLSIRNCGGETLNWEVLEQCPWLEAEPLAGQSVGEIDEVTLSVNVSGLSWGTYGCEITVSDADAVNSPRTVRVTLHVNTTLLVPAVFSTIQDAIDASMVGGDVVLVADGTYAGLGNKDLDLHGKAITVRSENGPDNCIIDCEYDGRGFYFHSGETDASVVDGFTIMNGYAQHYGGGIYCNESSPTISDCAITGNIAWSFEGDAVGGGGVYCHYSSPTISDCAITGNIAWSFEGGDAVGGGVCCSNWSNPTITNCAITGNIAENFDGHGEGGGVCCSDWSNPTITNCTIAENRADSGAGISCYVSNPTIANCTISGNVTHGISKGGGIYCWYDSGPSITNSTIAENTASSGGGIYCWYDSGPSITNSTIAENTAASGGGIWCGGSDPTITNCTISGNTVGNDGGGVYIIGDSDAALSDCTISGNTANVDGGGIYLDDCDLTIRNCTISGNTANNDGGGVYCHGGSPTISDCMIEANSSGGMYLAGGSATITYCTISGNASYSGGGITCASSAVPWILNCVITGNFATDLDAGTGGGLRCVEGSNAWIINSLISQNLAVNDGGGIFCSQSDPFIINCTINGNFAIFFGGGVSCDSGSLPMIRNCILWSDTAGLGGELALLNASELRVAYSDVQGGQTAAFVDEDSLLFWGLGNIDAEPLFVDPAGGDYGLSDGSPCIDAGDNWAVPDSVTTDLDGNPRFVDDPGTPDTGYGTPPIVDTGAYEFQGEPCFGDLDGDGDVDLSDLAILLANYGTTSGAAYEDGDLDGDGDVDLSDLAALLAVYGTTCP